ncbi:MAG: phosphatase PAP2 family protein [Anaerolineales bacterium]
MITFLQTDLLWVIAFQSLGDWPVAPMKFFSFLGSEMFFILVLPALYWSLDTALGMRVGVVLLLSGGINDLFKLAFHSPRPYWVSSGVRAHAAETSFGLPSGHAQISVGVWGMVSSYFRRLWVWLVAAALMLLIGLSRAFLGVHFFTDVVVGWLLGVILLWAILRAWEPAAAWAGRQSFGQQVFLAFLASLVIVLLNVFFLFIWQEEGQVVVRTWTATVVQAGVEPLPYPLTLNGPLTSAGTLFGLLVGIAWVRLWGGWRAEGPVWRRALRYLIGLMGVVLLWYGLGAVFPRGESLLPYGLRYVRYALLGFWVAGGAPWIFTKLKLSQPIPGEGG